MPWYYTLIKYLHVLAAIIAFGFNATYSIWLTRAQRNPEHLDFTLRGVKFLDDYVANPAYIFLLLSGLAMVAIGHYNLFSTFWLLAALIIFIAVALLGYGVYTPTLSRTIRALAANGAESAEFRELSTRGTVVGIILGVLVLTIVLLMVFQPVF